MNWKPWPDDRAQLSSDGSYSVHRAGNGTWSAWLRTPHLGRIGRAFENEQLAKAACEKHAKGEIV